MKTTYKATISTSLLVIFCGLIAVFAAACSGAGNGTANNTNTKTTNGTVNTAPVSAIPPNAPPGATPPNMLGSPTATVTLEEFADFQCPSCGDKHPVMKQIQSIYGSRIKFIFRSFPLPMHDKAYDAAVAAEAAGIQGKFWDMHNQLYTNQKTWSSDPNYKQTFADYAQKIGLDVEKFKDDMAGLQTKNRVDEDLKRGRAITINQTPTLFINGKDVPYQAMTVDTLRGLIDAELQAKQADKPAAAAPPANAANAAGNTANTNQK
ncbi:MAG: thioredoxin domain-containing protein [Acidobacteriota bacterium]